MVAVGPETPVDVAAVAVAVATSDSPTVETNAEVEASTVVLNATA